MTTSHALPAPPRRRTRRPLALAAAVLTALLLPGGWQSAQADTRDLRDLRPGVPGTALSWGDNSAGQLGDGATVSRGTVPGRVCGAAPCTDQPLQDVVSVSTRAYSTVALRADGTVVTWGTNAFGQLGDGTQTDRTTPVQVCAVGQSAPCTSFLTGVVAVAAGGNHHLALRSDGTVVAWGYNGSGQLGNGSSDPSSVPVEVPLTNVVAVAAGYNHSLALFANGSVAAWGMNFDGQLGDDTVAPSASPVLVCGVGETAPCGSHLGGVTAVAAGGNHSLALRFDGTVVTWGDNGSGQLGDGTTTDRHVPVTVCAPEGCGTPLTGITALSGGQEHSLALRTGGYVRAWGDNFAGQLGDGTTTDRPLPVRVCAPGVPVPCTTHLGGATAVAAGYVHSLALRTDGSVRSWGDNSDGQLGDGGIPSDQHQPVDVCAVAATTPCTRFLDGAVAIAGGLGHSVAVSRPRADLSVAVDAAPEPVASGGQLTYTVTVRNAGPNAAENVVLTDDLPANGRFVSATPSVGACTTPPVGSTDTVRCALGTLPAGGTATVTLAVTAYAVGTSGITDTVEVTADTTDPAPHNNTATITTPVS